jgi:hypothetical protein
MRQYPSYKVSDSELTGYPVLGTAPEYDAYGTFVGPQRPCDVLMPNVGCYNRTSGGYCTNPYCPTHGHYHRLRAALKRTQYDYLSCDTYYCTLPFAVQIVDYRLYLKVRRQFLKLLKQKKNLGPVVDCWNTEFLHGGIPHLNYIFRVGLGSDEVSIHKIVVKCWKAALAYGGIAYTTKHHIQTQQVGKTRGDVVHLMKYCFDTNPRMSINSAKPRGWKSVSYMSKRWRQDVVCVEPVDAVSVEDHCRDCFHNGDFVAGRKRTEHWSDCRIFWYETFECEETDCTVMPDDKDSGVLVELYSCLPRSLPHDGLSRAGAAALSGESRGGLECNSTNAPLPHAVQPRPPPRYRTALYNQEGRLPDNYRPRPLTVRHFEPPTRRTP